MIMSIFLRDLSWVVRVNMLVTDSMDTDTWQETVGADTWLGQHRSWHDIQCWCWHLRDCLCWHLTEMVWVLTLDTDSISADSWYYYIVLDVLGVHVQHNGWVVCVVTVNPASRCGILSGINYQHPSLILMHCSCLCSLHHKHQRSSHTTAMLSLSWGVGVPQQTDGGSMIPHIHSFIHSFIYSFPYSSLLTDSFVSFSYFCCMLYSTGQIGMT